MTRSKTLLLSTLAASALLSASAVSAQSVFTGADQAENLNEDLLDQIEDDAERDLDRFGNEGRAQGFSGSFALRGTADSGNSDTVDLGIGADLGYVSGVNGFNLQLNYTYGETDGSKTDENLVYGMEYTRDFNPDLFGFVKLQGSVDEFSSFETDTFLSFGAGYRVYNTPDIKWSVQAGPGYRFAEFSDVTEADVSEAAFGFSSDYSHRLTDTLYVTNDTDIIASDADTVVFNDLALSVSMTDELAVRTSILTEYHSDPTPGFKSTDNSFGVSLVYSF